MMYFALLVVLALFTPVIWSIQSDSVNSMVSAPRATETGEKAVVFASYANQKPQSRAEDIFHPLQHASTLSEEFVASIVIYNVSVRPSHPFGSDVVVGNASDGIRDLSTASSSGEGTAPVKTLQSYAMTDWIVFSFIAVFCLAQLRSACTEKKPKSILRKKRSALYTRLRTFVRLPWRRFRYGRNVRLKRIRFKRTCRVREHGVTVGDPSFCLPTMHCPKWCHANIPVGLTDVIERTYNAMTNFNAHPAPHIRTSTEQVQLLMRHGVNPMKIWRVREEIQLQRNGRGVERAQALYHDFARRITHNDEDEESLEYSGRCPTQKDAHDIALQLMREMEEWEREIYNKLPEEPAAAAAVVRFVFATAQWLNSSAVAVFRCLVLSLQHSLWRLVLLLLAPLKFVVRIAAQWLGLIVMPFSLWLLYIVSCLKRKLRKDPPEQRSFKEHVLPELVKEAHRFQERQRLARRGSGYAPSQWLTNQVLPELARRLERERSAQRLVDWALELGLLSPKNTVEAVEEESASVEDLDSDTVQELQLPGDVMIEIPAKKNKVEAVEEESASVEDLDSDTVQELQLPGDVMIEIPAKKNKKSVRFCEEIRVRKHGIRLGDVGLTIQASINQKIVCQCGVPIECTDEIVSEELQPLDSSKGYPKKDPTFDGNFDRLEEFGYSGVQVALQLSEHWEGVVQEPLLRDSEDEEADHLADMKRLSWEQLQLLDDVRKEFAGTIRTRRDEGVCTTLNDTVELYQETIAQADAFLVVESAIMKARRSAEQLHEEVMDDLLPKAVTFLAESERQADNRQRKERKLAEQYEEFAECAYTEYKRQLRLEKKKRCKNLQATVLPQLVGCVGDRMSARSRLSRALEEMLAKTSQQQQQHSVPEAAPRQEPEPCQCATRPRRRSPRLTVPPSTRPRRRSPRLTVPPPTRRSARISLLPAVDYKAVRIDFSMIK